MDEYKKIFKSPKLRRRLLEIAAFIPDKIMLKMQYRLKLGRKLDLNNPLRYTEKLQWYKLYYHNPIMHLCVDKYRVREFVKSKGLEDILVKLYGKYNSIDDIDWNNLPNCFVMKTTNGGGGINVVVCRDKSMLDIQDIKEKIGDGSNYILPHSGGREWAYYGLEKRIIVEELLENRENPEAGVNDYKFFCYNGHPEFVVVDVDRYINHKRNFYDINWNNLHIQSDCPEAKTYIPKPKNYGKMVDIATILSQEFPYVRVDLYNIEGRIFFGEMTFYPWSGYVKFSPDTFDIKLGEKFSLPSRGKRR